MTHVSSTGQVRAHQRDRHRQGEPGQHHRGDQRTREGLPGPDASRGALSAQRVRRSMVATKVPASSARARSRWSRRPGPPAQQAAQGGPRPSRWSGSRRRADQGWEEPPARHRWPPVAVETSAASRRSRPRRTRRTRRPFHTMTHVPQGCTSDDISRSGDVQAIPSGFPHQIAWST